MAYQHRQKARKIKREWGTGMMVERLKQEGTSHSSRDLLKIRVKMGPVDLRRFSDKRVLHCLGLMVCLCPVSERAGTHLLHRSSMSVESQRGGVR